MIHSILNTLPDHTIQIFVHNLNRLANAAVLESALPGFEKYPERALLMARTDDVVCVLSKVEEEYLQFLTSLNIGPRLQNVIVAGDHDTKNLVEAILNNDNALFAIANRIKPNQEVALSSFLFSEDDERLASVLTQQIDRNVSLVKNNVRIVEYANQKHHVREKANELGLPVPPGEILKLPQDRRGIESALRRQLQPTGSVVVKGAIGFSGSSIILASNDPESIRMAAERISRESENLTYVIEAKLPVSVSPNILMHISDDAIRCVAITDQLLDLNLVHQGNRYPSMAKTLDGMLETAGKLSSWLREEGYGGFAGFDFGEYYDSETKTYQHFLADINPRINAAAYPKFLMERLNCGAFLSSNLKTSARNFAELQNLCGDLFFNSETRSGLVPYNTGCLKYGKFSAAILGGTKGECQQIFEKVKGRFANSKGERYNPTTPNKLEVNRD